jgi:hypothetical protein
MLLLMKDLQQKEIENSLMKMVHLKNGKNIIDILKDLRVLFLWTKNKMV